MADNLTQIKTKVYDKCALEISSFTRESESKEYAACHFKLNERYVFSRNAKITPKKVGQFVTFWKRSKEGPIAPFHIDDQIDFFVVTVKKEHNFGQFVFPRSILIKKGILSTETKEGKRAFRVYPKWDEPLNKQAIQTQKWQLDYFYEINSSTDLKKVDELYKAE